MIFPVDDTFGIIIFWIIKRHAWGKRETLRTNFWSLEREREGGVELGRGRWKLVPMSISIPIEVILCDDAVT